MTKHCVLILAHRLPWLVRRLVNLLSERFIVIVHVDASVRRSDFESASATIVPYSRRIRWGSYAMVAATLDMLRLGLENTEVRTFTLISGDTYPVVSLDRITKILDQGVDRIDSSIIGNSSETFKRISGIYLPDTRLGDLRPGLPYLYRSLDQDLTQVIAEAERARLDRPEFLKEFRYAKGAQWWSLTRSTIEAVIKLTDSHSLFRNAMRFSAIPDESYFQTAIIALGLHEKIGPGPVYTNWDTIPAPHTFAAPQDLDTFQRQKRPFARKFGETSIELIKMIEKDF